MKQKKLIIFIPSIEGGGVEKNLYIIANFLAKKISDIGLISCSFKQKKKFDRVIQFISPRSIFWDKTSRRIKYFICLILLIKEILKNNKIVILAFQANLYAAIIAKIFGIKIITRSNTSPSGWSKNLIKIMLYKIFLRFPDHIIVNSFKFKSEFKSLFNINTECIYNPLNKIEILKKSQEKVGIKFFTKKTLNIISAGRLVDQKDFITLLKAINILKLKINPRVMIIGRGVEKKKLIKYVKCNYLNKYVKLIPFQKNLYKYIKKCDLFILTSKYEGLPNVLLEAQVLKKYIIATNCPTGPSEILLNGKAGDLIKVGDYIELSRKISDFYLNKNKKKNEAKIALGNKYLGRFEEKKNLNKYYFAVNRFLNY